MENTHEELGLVTKYFNLLSIVAFVHLMHYVSTASLSCCVWVRFNLFRGWKKVQLYWMAFMSSDDKALQALDSLGSSQVFKDDICNEL